MEDFEMDIAEVMRNRIKLRIGKNERVSQMLLTYISFL